MRWWSGPLFDLIPEAARNVTVGVLHLNGGLHAFGDVRWVRHAEAP